MRMQWQMWNGTGGIDNAAIENLFKISNERKIDKAAVGTEDETSVKNNKVRSSQVAWMTDVTWVRDLLYEYIKQGNRNAFNVQVDNIADIQYTEYHASEGGHYDWHIDTFWDEQKPYDRKLSVTVQLSDPSEYEGGEFEFDETENPNSSSRSKGTVLIFPSYIRHRVKPITKGVRKSLVAWFEGPRWS